MDFARPAVGIEAAELVVEILISILSSSKSAKATPWPFRRCPSPALNVVSSKRCPASLLRSHWQPGMVEAKLARDIRERAIVVVAEQAGECGAVRLATGIVHRRIYLAETSHIWQNPLENSKAPQSVC